MNGRSQRHERRGGVYLLVLGSTMLVTVIGLTAMMAVQIQHRTAVNTEDQLKARLCAQAGIEMATYWIKDDPNWRENRVNGWWEQDRPVGDGMFSLKITDPADSDLANTTTDSILVYSKGQRGGARHLMQVTMNAVQATKGPPMAVLNYAIHTGGELWVQTGTTLTANLAPASTNSQFKNDGTLAGDVEAVTETGSGTVTGTKTIPAPTKTMPDPALVDQYIALAMQLTYSGKIANMVLSPGANTYGGGLDPDGLYYIDTNSNDLVIEYSRIYGTLVVDAPGKTVLLKSVVLLQNYRGDYPVLIVRGNLTIDFTASADGLSEVARGINYNPSGAPYLGINDVSIADTYPSRIDGLVFCTGNLIIQNSGSVVNGAVICGGTAEVGKTFTINYDSNLTDFPPQGFTDDPTGEITMQIVRGSWKQVVQ